MASKSIKELHHYGDYVIKLLEDTHYCLRRNLYDTNKQLFVQAKYQHPALLLYSYGGRVRIDRASCTQKHYINN